MLFFDPILSGTRDVACATCHLAGRGTSDGVALSLGVRATGLAEERRALDTERVHPRNTMDIWNRGHPSVRNMFWDGRVSEIEAPVSRFQTPMMDYLPDGIESVLAAQALFPLAGEEEMLGLPHDPLGARPPRRPRRQAQRDRPGGSGLRRVRTAALRRSPRTRSCAGSSARPARPSPTGRLPTAGSSPRRYPIRCSAPSPWATSPTPLATSRNSPSSRTRRRGTATSRARRTRSTPRRSGVRCSSTARAAASPVTAARS